MTSIEAIIDRQFRLWERRQVQVQSSPEQKPQPRQIVTVSRETGSRGSYFASRLALRLGYQRIHREVIDEICASSGYRKRVIESVDGKARSDLEMMVEGLLTGQSVDMGDYARHLYRVILSMSHLGGVVLVGRGGNFILGPMRGFHIRFVAPRERRIANLIDYKQMKRLDAEESIDQSDRERRAFVRKLFDADINDPQHYDLVINSAYIDVEELVATTELAVRGKTDKLLHLDNDMRSDRQKD
jgi:cytidylate kinase